jgi:hypothetical protein
MRIQIIEWREVLHQVTESPLPEQDKKKQNNTRAAGVGAPDA